MSQMKYIYIEQNWRHHKVVIVSIKLCLNVRNNEYITLWTFGGCIKSSFEVTGGEPLPRSQKAKKHPVGIGLKELSLNPPDRRLHNLEILSQKSLV